MRCTYFYADRPAPQKARRFVIELFADFLPDAAPHFGLRLHRLGLNDFFDHRQVVRQARRAFAAGTNNRKFRNRWQRRSGPHRGRRGQRHEEFELRGIQRLAARAENATHQQINLLPQQGVLPLRLRQGRLALRQLLGEFGFAG